MELQEFTPHLLLAQLRPVRPVAAVLDTRGAFVDHAREALALDNWGYGDDGVEIASSDRRELYRLNIHEVSASAENFESFEAARSRITEFLAMGLKHLGDPDVAWIGIRSHDLAPADDFAELQAALIRTHSPSAAHLVEMVGAQPSDVGWQFDFHEGHPRITVRFGPMKAEQARTQLFRDNTETHYPEQFLFLDVDRVLPELTLSAVEALEKSSDSLEKQRALVGRVAEWLSDLQ